MDALDKLKKGIGYSMEKNPGETAPREEVQQKISLERDTDYVVLLLLSPCESREISAKNAKLKKRKSALFLCGTGSPDGLALGPSAHLLGCLWTRFHKQRLAYLLYIPEAHGEAFYQLP